MSCFFCKSRIHASQNCNIYESDESRQKRANVKKCCQNCLTPLKNRSSCCESCKQNQKCYICFSPRHHTVYCPDRYLVSTLFLPNIDKVLFPRFMAFLKIHEKYLMAFSYPVLLNLVSFMPIKIFYREDVVFPDFLQWRRPNSNELNVAESVHIKLSRRQHPYYNEYANQTLKLSLQSRAFFIQNLGIYSLSLLAEEILLLLSTKTRKLVCRSTKFLPKLIFREILQNAPYLEEINVSLTDVQVDSSWADDLLELCNAENLKRIDLAIPDLSFNAESLAALMKKKSAICLIIHLYLIVPHSECFDASKNHKIFETVNDKLNNFFIASKDNFQQFIKIRSVCDTALWIMSHEFQTFVLKSR